MQYEEPTWEHNNYENRFWLVNIWWKMIKYWKYSLVYNSSNIHKMLINYVESKMIKHTTLGVVFDNTLRHSQPSKLN